MKKPDKFPSKESERIYPILLVNPSMDTRQYCREDRLRTYLSLGTLSSALRDKRFIKKFVRLSGRTVRFGNHPVNNFSFDVRVLNLSLKPKNQKIGEFFESYVKESEIHPLLIGMTATSAQLDEAREIGNAASQVFQITFIRS